MSTQVTNLPIPCDIGLQQQRFRVYVVAKIFWWEPPRTKNASMAFTPYLSRTNEAARDLLGRRWREAASLRQLLIGSRRATTHERLNLRRRQLSVFVGIHRLEDFGMSGLEFLKR